MAGYVNVADFGAVGDGVTDDTAAFNAAHVCAAGHKTAVYAPGTTNGYKLCGTVAVRTRMFGDGLLQTNLCTASASADMLQIVAPGVTLEGLWLSSSVTRTGGYYLNSIGVNYVTLEKLLLDGWYNGIGVTGAGGAWFHATDCYLQSATPGGVGINFATTSNGVDNVLENIVITGPPTGPQPAAGVQFSGVGDATLDHVSTVHIATGLNVSPCAGQTVQALLVNDSFFDSGSYAGINVAPAAGGAVQLLRVNQTWSCSNSHGMLLNGAGAIQDVEIHNAIFSNNAAGAGLNVVTATASNIRILGGAYSANSYGMIFGANVKNFEVIGARCGPCGQFAGNTNQGLYVSAGCDEFNISNNNFSGNAATTAYVGPSPGTPNVSYFIKGNRGLASV